MTRPSPIALLTRIRQAVSEGHAEGALELLEQLLAEHPGHREGLMLKASVHSEMGQAEDALRALDDALMHHGEDVALLLMKVGVLLEFFDDAESAQPLMASVMEILDGQTKTEREDADRIRLMQEAWLMMAELRSTVDDTRGAEEAARKAVQLGPRNPAAHLSLSNALLERGQLDDALAAAKLALREHADLADAHAMVGRLLWLRGDEKSGRESLSLASSLEPMRYWPPVPTTKEHLLSVIREAVKELPVSVRAALEKVPVEIDDAPSEERVNARVPRASFGALGMYEGTPPDLSPDDNPWDHLPARVVIFRRNMELTAEDEGEFKDLCLVTLLNELAEYLHMDLEMLDKVMPQ